MKVAYRCNGAQLTIRKVPEIPHQFPMGACTDESTLLRVLCVGMLPRSKHLTNLIQNRNLGKVFASL